MKRLLSLTLALLMAVTLFAASGWKNYACAEENDPYVGLWEITGQLDGDTYSAYADVGMKAYLDFLPNGAIYAVMIMGDSVSDDYLAYKVTGENALALYEGGDPLPGVYDPATGILTVTDTQSNLISYVERVQENPLPDLRALVDHSQDDRNFYGYMMSESGQTMNMLEVLPLMGMDPTDVYLTLYPDGTGYMQLGDEEASGEITWTETEFIAEGEAVPYTWVGDHILMAFEETYSIEFAPEGEVEALMAMMGTEVVEPVEVEADADAIVGEWKLAKATAAGQELTLEQIQAQGLDLAFRFNANGSAVMINKGEETPGLNWAVDGSELTLSMYTYELFTFSYDGEYLILSMGAKLYFEKVS